MGSGREFECSKCGKRYYANTGIGFMFPEVYSKLTEDIANGKYGDDLKTSFKSVKHAAVDAEYHLYKCGKCNYWVDESGMSLYAPNDGCRIEKTSYIMPHELKTNYHVYKKYVHKCKECGSIMHKATKKELENLKCPHCGGNPKEEKAIYMFWD